MLLFWIFNVAEIIELGSFKYVAFICGVTIFPTGLQLIKRNLSIEKSNSTKGATIKDIVTK